MLPQPVTVNHGGSMKASLHVYIYIDIYIYITLHVYIYICTYTYTCSNSYSAVTELPRHPRFQVYAKGPCGHIAHLGPEVAR